MGIKDLVLRKARAQFSNERGGRICKQELQLLLRLQNRMQTQNKCRPTAVMAHAREGRKNKLEQVIPEPYCR
jgi:hypothetical protein